MWLLYEVGIVFSRTYKQRIADAGVERERRYNQDDTASTQDTHKPASHSAKGKSDDVSDTQKATSTDVVDPSQVQTPDSEGKYRNSLTDSSDDNPDSSSEDDKR